jgi:hypothetical protein
MEMSMLSVETTPDGVGGGIGFGGFGGSLGKSGLNSSKPVLLWIGDCRDTLT